VKATQAVKHGNPPSLQLSIKSCRFIRKVAVRFYFLIAWPKTVGDEVLHIFIQFLEHSLDVADSCQPKINGELNGYWRNAEIAKPICLTLGRPTEFSGSRTLSLISRDRATRRERKQVEQG